MTLCSQVALIETLAYFLFVMRYQYSKRKDRRLQKTDFKQSESDLPLKQMAQQPQSIFETTERK